MGAPADWARMIAYLPGGKLGSVMVTVSEPLELEQKNCVSVGAVRSVASSR